MYFSSLGIEGQRNITETDKTLEKDKQNFKHLFCSYSFPSDNLETQTLAKF